MYGGCDTCKHIWGEENCKGCLWDGKSQRNTHWEQEELDITTPKKVVGKMISTGVLDKIRAEIETEKNAGCHTQYAGGLDFALSIIDKYMKESEGTE